MKITANKSVSAEYELFVDGETEGELELMEKATAEQPLTFVYGVGMMLPKFEEHLFGLATGDKFEFTLNVEDAYGEYEDANVIDLDRSIFEVDGQLDEKVIFAGNVVPLMDSEGNRLNAQVVEVSSTSVKVDLNHPLAGETLHFKGSVLEVHEATEEELNAIFGGGGGCGCGSGGCGCDDEHDHGHEHGKGGCGCH
jgi:FKBP-type peptidyl-prolyl cis-trans isomerase SlyD